MRWATLALLLIAGCGRAPATAPDGDAPLVIAATVGMVGDLAAAVAGDHATVVSIVGPGVDPHLYKPTRDDVATLLDADVIAYCGLMLEGKMADTLDRVGAARPTIAVGELLPPDQLMRDESAGHDDPHVWMDPSLWGDAAVRFAEVLAEHDPAHADEYRVNAASYAASCRAMHAYGRSAIESVPAAARVLVTSHDAFGYFGRAYDVDVRGVQGISTESEAGLRDINALVDFLVERGVPSVFVETSVPQKSIQALIDGAESRGATVVIGGELFSDAMGADGTYEGTYLGMLDHNITTITRALGGDAPERGLHGRLAATPEE